MTRSARQTAVERVRLYCAFPTNLPAALELCLWLVPVFPATSLSVSVRREEEEKSDNMKQLENRTLDSKIELEIMDALDEIKAVNRRHETINTAEVLKASAARREKGSAALVSQSLCCGKRRTSERRKFGFKSRNLAPP